MPFNQYLNDFIATSKNPADFYWSVKPPCAHFYANTYQKPISRCYTGESVVKPSTNHTLILSNVIRSKLDFGFGFLVISLGMTQNVCC